MADSIVNLLKDMPNENPDQPETIEDIVGKNKMEEINPLRIEDLIIKPKMLKETLKTIPFSIWITEICESFKYFKKINIDGIPDIDKKSTIAIKIPVKNKYHLLTYNDMKNFNIIDLPVQHVMFFQNRMFYVIFKFNDNFFIKAYYDNQKEAEFVVCFSTKEGFLIPFEFKKYKTKEKEIVINYLVEESSKILEERLDQPVNLNFLIEQYSMTKKSKVVFKTNRDVLIWFNEIIEKTIDKKHLIKIDTAIKLLFV
jgi:hypothetical protein